MVQIFREVRRVLRSDGTLWLNLGDSYAANGVSGLAIKGATSTLVGSANHAHTSQKKTVPSGLKPKDLCGIPWRVALALQQPYHTGCIKNEVDRAWLAGFIDADGSIGIRIQHNKKWSNPTYIPYLTVSCSDVIALERCIYITGLGKINLKHKAGSTDYRGINTKRDYYTWRLDGQIASKVIRDIYPYLIIKKLQAQLVYNQNLSLKWGRPRKDKPVPPDVAKYREHLYQSIKLLNQRQPCELPNLKPVDPAVEPGWWLRSDIIWHKPNPMPESVTDRCCKSHEYMFMLTKSPKYYFDSEAIKEDAIGNGSKDMGQKIPTDGQGKGSSQEILLFGKGTSNKEGISRNIRANGRTEREIPNSGTVARTGREIQDSEQEIWGKPEGEGAKGKERQDIYENGKRKIFKAEDGNQAQASNKDNGLHLNTESMERNQGTIQPLLCVLSEENGAVGNGSCDSSFKRRASHEEKHSSGVSELQRKKGSEAVHGNIPGRDDGGRACNKIG